jgi:hypothetical protein
MALGDALLGQRLAQPGMLVVHVYLSLVAGSLRSPFHGIARAGTTFRAAAAMAARVWA